MKQEMTGWQWHQLDHFITQFCTGWMLFLMPRQQCQSTEGIFTTYWHHNFRSFSRYGWYPKWWTSRISEGGFCYRQDTCPVTQTVSEHSKALNSIFISIIHSHTQTHKQLFYSYYTLC